MRFDRPIQTLPAADRGHKPRSGRPPRSEPTPEMLAAHAAAASLARRGYRPSCEAIGSILGCPGRAVWRMKDGYLRLGGTWPAAPAYARVYPCSRRPTQTEKAALASDVPYIFPVGAICHVKSDEPDDYRPRPFRAVGTPSGDFTAAERRFAVDRMRSDWKAGRLPRFLTCGRGREVA